MHTKLLTISIAAYNVEPFLENALNHLVVSEWLDRLEVFIIDDGGKDNSLQIARCFEKKYPDTFHAVHKENGGYGSTVSYTIAHATGKYFKLLDGDDWFDRENFKKILGSLDECNEDVVITDYYIGPDESNLSIVSCNHENGTIVNVSGYRTDIPHGMWSIFYKTDLLQKSNIDFPLHTLYTDQLYATIPFAYANRILFLATPVYCYRFGRNEQSTSRVSRVKHAQEMFAVCNILYDFYERHKQTNNQYLLSRIARYYLGAIRTILLMPVTRKNKEKLMEYEHRNKESHPDIYYAAEKGTAIASFVGIMRRTGYFAYWITRVIPKNRIDF